jgi:hypothetical protein
MVRRECRNNPVGRQPGGVWVRGQAGNRGLETNTGSTVSFFERVFAIKESDCQADGRFKKTNLARRGLR